jgi:hypothetical protein
LKARFGGTFVCVTGATKREASIVPGSPTYFRRFALHADDGKSEGGLRGLPLADFWPILPNQLAS